VVPEGGENLGASHKRERELEGGFRGRSLVEEPSRYDNRGDLLGVNEKVCL
jgi:hypothetical protein